MPEENIRVMKRWFQEVWNEGKLQTIHDLFHPDGVAIGQAGPQAEIRGPAAFERFVQSIRGAFPDIRLVVEDAFGQDDKVAVRWSATMTHRGDDLGTPATGKPVRITGTTIVRMRNGQVVEGWDNWDQMAMLQQIGAYEPPPAMSLPKSA